MTFIAAAFGALFAVGLVVGLIALVASLLVTLFLALESQWIPVIYNVRSLTRRKVTTTAAVLGMALAVAVFSGALMLRAGIQKTLATAGREDNVLVLRKGSNAEITSVIERDQAKLLMARDEVQADTHDGKPLADPQLAVLIFAQRVGGTSTDGANIFVRGCSERMIALHPTAKLKEGRWFSAGTSEVVIGKALVGNFIGATLGGEIRFARRGWKVVGIVDTDGSSFDSEIWGDTEQVMEAFQRTLYSTLVMRLKDRRQVPALADAVGLDPRLALDVKQERKYYEDLSQGLAALMTFLGLFIAVVFSLAATLGAMIAMYAQVTARLREVGVLRALGYQRSSILVSFVLESIFMGVAAGVIGVGLSSLAQLVKFSTLNFGTFSEVTFRFTLTPGIASLGMLFAVTIGYAGGFFPAARAARKPLVEAMKG